MLAFKSRFFVLTAVSIFLAASLFSSKAFAQGVDTALLRGTVTDSSGAVIPGATVTMTNVGTGISEKRPTDQAGRYLVREGSLWEAPVSLPTASAMPLRSFGWTAA